MLLENKPFKFQKKKMQIYNAKLKEIEEKIMKLYADIAQELHDIEKLQEPIKEKEEHK